MSSIRDDDIEKNRKARMDAVEKWAKYVRDNNNMEWSRQQKVLIDSQIQNARKIKLTREQVEYIKGRKI